MLSASGTIPFSTEKSWDLNASTTVYVSGFSFAYAKNSPVLPIGKISATAKMNGSIDHPVLNIDVAGNGLSTGAITADTMILHGDYSDNRLNSTLLITLHTGVVKALLKADVNDLFSAPVVGKYTIGGTVRHLDIKRLLQSSYRDDLSLNVSDGRFMAEGFGLQRLPDSLSANLRAHIGGSVEKSLNAAAALNRNQWTFSVVSVPDIDLQGSGRYSDSGAISGLIKLRVDRLSEITAFVTKEPVLGAFSAEAHINGTIKNPGVSVAVGGGALSYKEYQVDTLYGNLNYSDKKFDWKSLFVKREKSIVESNGSVMWMPSATVAEADCRFVSDTKAVGTVSAHTRFTRDSIVASVKVSDFDPAFVAPWVVQANKINGRLWTDCTVSGLIKNPVVYMNFSFDHPVSKNLVLSASGNLGYSKGVATARIRAAQSGAARSLSVIATIPVVFKDLSKGVDAMQNGAHIKVHGDSISTNGFISALAPSIQSDGTISIDGSLTKSNAVWEVLCSTRIVNRSLVAPKEEIKAGQAAIDLRLSGVLPKPAVRFVVRGDSVEYRGAKILEYLAQGLVTRDLIALDSLRITVPGGGMDVRASIPFDAKTGLSVDRNSRISATINKLPLSVFQPFLSELAVVNKGEVSGKIVVEVASGRFPRARGFLSVEKGEFYLGECYNMLGPASLYLDFKNDSIVLRKLDSPWGKGSITGTGRAILDASGLSGVRGDIKLRDVRLDGCSENLDLGIQSTDIILTMDSVFHIAANVVLAKSSMIQDISLVDISEHIKAKKMQIVRSPNPLFNKVAMHVAVNLNSNLTFDSNLGKLVVDGTVTAIGRPDNPSITGQIQILSGYVFYLDRKFTVTNGVIRQYDPKQINPSVDITATAPVVLYPVAGNQEQYDITLRIKGDLSAPVITMTSVPALPLPQIITLLTLGTLHAGAGTDLASRTGDMVSHQLAGFGTRKLARLLNVESIDLLGSIFDPAAEDPQLSITKQVTSRVAVTYKKSLSKLSQQVAMVSYRIFPFLFIEAESDQHAAGGIDLKFRYSR